MNRRALRAGVCFLTAAIIAGAQVVKDKADEEVQSACDASLSRFVARFAQLKAEAATKPAKAAELAEHIQSYLSSLTPVAECVVARKVAAETQRNARIVRAQVERNRVDKQDGASASTGGGNNLVSSGSAPNFLGLSWEAAGITRGLRGQTLTYRVNPAKTVAALAQAFANDDWTEPADPAYRLFKRLDLALSFDTARSAARKTPLGGVVGAEFQQFSEFGARWQLVNHRDVFSQSAREKFSVLANSAAAVEYAGIARDLGIELLRSTRYASIVARTKDELNKAEDAENARKALEAYLEETDVLFSQRPRLNAAFENYAVRRKSFDQGLRRIYDDVAKSLIVTLEYNFVRPPEAKPDPEMPAAKTLFATRRAAAALGVSAAVTPDHSFARLVIADRFVGESEWTLTLSGSMFHEVRAGMRGNFRDFQAGLKVDIPLPEMKRVGKGTLSFAGLYEYLHQRPLGVDLRINDVTVNQPGNIGFFQAKYSIPLGDSGFRVPLSLTVSNRTELIKEKEVRGSIGVTFDLDKLLAK